MLLKEENGANLFSVIGKKLEQYRVRGKSGEKRR